MFRRRKERIKTGNSEDVHEAPTTKIFLKTMKPHRACMFPLASRIRRIMR